MIGSAQARNVTRETLGFGGGQGCGYWEIAFTKRPPSDLQRDHPRRGLRDKIFASFLQCKPEVSSVAGHREEPRAGVVVPPPPNPVVKGQGGELSLRMSGLLPGPVAPVLLCPAESPKRVLVSVIKTTPVKPARGGSSSEEPSRAPPPIPTSPGFSDFMVYPWRWGENAHNVTLSPPPTATQPLRGDEGRVGGPCGEVEPPGGEDEEAGSPDSGSGHLRVSTAPTGLTGRESAHARVKRWRLRERVFLLPASDGLPEPSS